MSYSPDPDTSSVFACLAINGILGLVFYSLFEIFRSKELEVYAPRLRSHKDAVGEKPSNSLFGWIGPTWRATDDEVLRIAGMDGYVMLRFLRMCTTIGGHCCLGLVVLLPVYATAPGNPNVNGINKISMANLIEGGDRLWVSLLFYYAFTFVFLYFIYKEYENFAAKRRHFFREGDATINPQVNYSVQVENIPVEYRSSKKLESFFNYLFPREIICASVSVGCPALVEAVAKRKIAVNNLEKAVALMEADDNRTRPTLSLKKGKPALCGGDEKNVDSISYWENEISTLNYTIAKLKVDAARLEADEVIINKSVESGLDKHLLAEDTPDPKQFMTCTGFVTFSSRRSQSTACQVSNRTIVAVYINSYKLLWLHRCPFSLTNTLISLLAVPLQLKISFGRI